jgi:hypothetical protein
MTHTAKPFEEIAIIELFNKKIRQCKANRIMIAKMPKDSHQRYVDMTDEEFHQHKLSGIRHWREEQKKYEKENNKKFPKQKYKSEK